MLLVLSEHCSPIEIFWRRDRAPPTDVSVYCISDTSIVPLPTVKKIKRDTYFHSNTFETNNDNSFEYITLVILDNTLYQTISQN